MSDFHDNSREILDILDPIDVVSGYINLKKSSNNEYTAVCPFHDDKNPSFFINSENGLWFCFGCGQKGNLIQFMEEINKEDYVTSMNRLAKLANVEYSIGELTENERMKRARLEILEKTQNFLAYTLNEKSSEFALNTILSRGFDKEDVVKIGLGFANKDKYDRFFKANNFDIDKQQATRLKSINNNLLIDTIPNRITFPIRNIRGDLLGFSGGRIDKETVPKYKHSIFLDSGSGYFYNDLNINDEDTPITIVEGFFDQMSLEKAGIKNVISSLGTSINEEKVKELLNVHRNFVICMDGDDPGLKAATKLSLIIKTLDQFNDVKVSFVLIPDKLDPDDFRQKFGENKLKEVFDNQLSEIEFRKNIIDKDSFSKEQLLREYIKIGIYADDALQLELYLQELAKEFNVSYDSIKSGYDKVKDLLKKELDKEILDILSKAKFNETKSKTKNNSNKNTKSDTDIDQANISQNNQNQSNTQNSKDVSTESLNKQDKQAKIEENNAETDDEEEFISADASSFISDLLGTDNENNEIDKLLVSKEKTIICYLIENQSAISIFKTEEQNQVFRHDYVREVWDKMIKLSKEKDNFDINDLNKFIENVEAKLFLIECKNKLDLIKRSKGFSITKSEFDDLVDSMRTNSKNEFLLARTIRNVANDIKTNPTTDKLDDFFDNLRNI